MQLSVRHSDGGGLCRVVPRCAVLRCLALPEKNTRTRRVFSIFSFKGMFQNTRTDSSETDATLTYDQIRAFPCVLVDLLRIRSCVMTDIHERRQWWLALRSYAAR